MDHDRDKYQASPVLRKQALDILHNSPQSIATLPEGDIVKLAHELSVYQIELEMQNEELRRANDDLFDSREQYSNLYEFAPAGYFTLNTKWVIQKINLTATTMLGFEKTLLRG